MSDGQSMVAEMQQLDRDLSTTPDVPTQADRLLAIADTLGKQAEKLRKIIPKANGCGIPRRIGDLKELAAELRELALLSTR